MKRWIILFASFFIFLLFSFALVQGNEVVVIPLGSGETQTIGDFVEGGARIGLTGDDKIISTVSLNIEKKGFVVVNASGYFEFYEATDKSTLVRCSITQLDYHETSMQFVGGSYTTDSIEYVPFGATRAFNVTPGIHHFNLVCDQLWGIDNEVEIVNPYFNAVFYYQY